MNDTFTILITYIRKEDMDLMRCVTVLNRDTTFGQNYMYWKEDNIEQLYAALFDFDDEVEILAVEELNGGIK